MPKISFSRIVRPRYAVPIAGWVGCAFLLKFMVAGMAGHGLVQSTADHPGWMAALEKPNSAGDEVRVATPASPLQPGTAVSAETRTLKTELAEQSASETAI